MPGDNGINIEAEAPARPGGLPAVRVPIKVVPGARRQRIVGPHGGALKVMIAQPPEGGAANRALCQLLAKALAIPVRQVQVVAGQGSAWKMLRIEGVTIQQARQRLLPGK